MKSTLVLSLAALLTASACANGDDDALSSPSDQDPVAIERGGNPPPPPLGNLVSITVTPAPLPGGHPATAVFTYSGLGSPGSQLVSNNPAVLSVPSQFFARSHQSTGWLNIVTSAVLAPTSVTITATQNTTGIVSSVVVDVVPATAPPIADNIAVQKARFKFVGGRGGNIEVDATSSNPNAILTVWFLPGNFEGFVLVNQGGGRYSAQRPTTSSSVPPQIYVKSNFGGVSRVFDL